MNRSPTSSRSHSKWRASSRPGGSGGLDLDSGYPAHSVLDDAVSTALDQVALLVWTTIGGSHVHCLEDRPRAMARSKIYIDMRSVGELSGMSA